MNGFPTREGRTPDWYGPPNYSEVAIASVALALAKLQGAHELHAISMP